MTEEYDYYREDEAEPRGKVRIMQFRRNIKSVGFASQIFGDYASEDCFSSNPVTSFENAERNVQAWAQSNNYRLEEVS